MTLKVVMIGGLAFWLPDTLWHAARRNAFDAPDVWLITLLMPVALLCALKLVTKRFHMPASNIACRMLLGVWVLGGLFMMISACIGGDGGFAGQDGIRGGLLMVAMSLFPPVTFMLATYDGSLAALTLVTLVLLIVWVHGLVRRRLLVHRLTS